MFDKTRRNLLNAGIATGLGLMTRVENVFAQEQAPALLRAPKHALVIGNENYRDFPLRNPINDAMAMSAALEAAGFAVSTGRDLTQDAMNDLLRSYLDRLAKSKAVGVFYFAGHGTQLAWRNYIVPLGEQISGVDAIRERCVDINTLIDGIRKAGNPMNVIILDACRDNPFGKQVQLEQRGLSQLDAPPGTLLAYATAPGNVANDGEGQNGLYTEHLLREMKVPDAKIEDIFKRVRLGVRRASKGTQIPWESTSLEEDFWFHPPQELRKLAEAEIEREFQAEFFLWEKIKQATTAEPFEDYLQRYPSGRFTEIAQLQLDRALAKLGENKVQVVSAPENPYSKGTSIANTQFAVGDSYTYRLIDTLTRVESGQQTTTVTEIAENRVLFNKGTLVTDLLGNTIYSMKEREVSTDRQFYANEYSIGKKWSCRFFGTGTEGQKLHYEYTFKVLTREQKKVPAGVFDAFKVEGRGRASSGSNLQVTYWIAPARVNRPIAIEWLNVSRAGRIYFTDAVELVSFTQTR